MKISVIIPTYNGSKTIEKTLDSVLSQHEISDLEVFAIDDGSTDTTVGLLSKYKEVIVKTFYDNSGGPNRGRNFGFHLSTGDYIAFCDQDDIWDRYKLSIQLEHKQDIILSAITKNDKKDKIYTKGELFRSFLRRDKIDTCLSTFLIKKSIFKPFEYNFGMLDYDWLLRISQNSTAYWCSSKLVTKGQGNNLSLKKEYRLKDFYFSLLTLENYDEPDAIIGRKKLYATMGKYYYKTGNCKKARQFFGYDKLSIKNFAYYYSSFICPNFVNEHFRVFG